tara:strand:+ start:516 stop:722 length:207 start_codon:yes stop_codon:yes gene_type:complete
MTPLDSLSILYILVGAVKVEMINLFGVLDPCINSFIKIVFVIGPLSFACMILLLKRIEKENPERIGWK